MSDSRDTSCGCESDCREYREKLRGVECGVESCRYHSSGDCCTAGCISVESRNAIRKGETFCGTFEPRATL